MSDKGQRIDVVGMARMAQERIAKLSPSKQDFLRRVVATYSPPIVSLVPTDKKPVLTDKK